MYISTVKTVSLGNFKEILIFQDTLFYADVTQVEKNACKFYFMFCVVQLRVIAYDTELPDLQTTATVYVTVNRNLGGPVVVPPNVVINASQDEPVQSWGYPVNVTDPDSVSKNIVLLNFDCKKTSMLIKKTVYNCQNNGFIFFTFIVVEMIFSILE